MHPGAMIRNDLRKLYFARAVRKKYPKRGPKRLPRIQYPALIEQRYASDLLEMVRFLKSRIDARIKPLLPGLIKTYARVRSDADDDLGTLADELEKVRIEFNQAYTPEEIKRLSETTGKSVADWNAMQMNSQMKGVAEIDVFGSEPWLKKEMGGFVVQNVGLIQSIGEEYLGQVEQMVSTAVRSGVRAEDLADDIESRYDVSASRASLIARDQIGKFQGQLTELRQTNLGIDEYTWRTAGDSRVRDSHRAHEGKVFAWSDPPADTGHPGDDYQCRCSAEPVLAKFFESDA